MYFRFCCFIPDSVSGVCAVSFPFGWAGCWIRFLGFSSDFHNLHLIHLIHQSPTIIACLDDSSESANISENERQHENAISDTFLDALDNTLRDPNNTLGSKFNAAKLDNT